MNMRSGQISLIAMILIFAAALYHAFVIKAVKIKQLQVCYSKETKELDPACTSQITYKTMFFNFSEVLRID